MTELETEIERIYTSPGPHHPAEIAWLVIQARRLMRENTELNSEVERLQHDIADLQMLRDEHQMDVMHAFQEGGHKERGAVVVAEVERLRYLLKKATGIIPRDVAEATVFSQHGNLYAHKFQHKYANEAACGYRPRGPYQPLREEDLTCPDCIDVIRAIGLASETIERGEHRREEER